MSADVDGRRHFRPGIEASHLSPAAPKLCRDIDIALIDQANGLHIVGAMEILCAVNVPVVRVEKVEAIIWQRTGPWAATTGAKYTRAETSSTRCFYGCEEAGRMGPATRP
jgi:hypothetical protein